MSTFQPRLVYLTVLTALVAGCATARGGSVAARGAVPVRLQVCIENLDHKAHPIRVDVDGSSARLWCAKSAASSLQSSSAWPAASAALNAFIVGP